eukprot:COSAG04_NODE_1439_length_6765_cov_8.284878_5_plen_79_part_00
MALVVWRIASPLRGHNVGYSFWHTLWHVLVFLGAVSARGVGSREAVPEAGRPAGQQRGRNAWAAAWVGSIRARIEQLQ